MSATNTRTTQTVTTDTAPANVTTVNLRNRSKKKKAVQWEENVVDNENLGRKSSKICCIYEAPRTWDDDSDSESSSEEGHDPNCISHHHHKRPVQHPHDDKPFTGNYDPAAS